MRHLLLAAAVLALGANTAAAQPANACHSDRVSDIAGIYLQLSSGQIFEPFPGRDRSTASLWLPQDKLRLCVETGTVYRITDLTLGGRPIQALYLP